VEDKFVFIPANAFDSGEDSDFVEFYHKVPGKVGLKSDENGSKFITFLLLQLLLDSLLQLRKHFQPLVDELSVSFVAFLPFFFALTESRLRLPLNNPINERVLKLAEFFVYFFYFVVF